MNREFEVYFQAGSDGRIRGRIEAHEIWGNKDFSMVTVVLDKRATLTPKDSTSWWVRFAGSTRDRRVVFVIPVEPAKERAKREWEEKLRQRAEAEAAATRAAARELKKLDPTLVAEVERVVAAIKAGPTRPAPARPPEPVSPTPATLGWWGDYTITFSPGEDRPFSLRAEYRQAGPARGALSEGVDVALRFVTSEDLAGALRTKGAPEDAVTTISAKAVKAEAEWQKYEAARASYKAALASYEAERQAWLNEGHNRLVDLHRRGWLQIETYGGRDWLHAATPDGDEIPVLTRAQLERALK